MNDMNPDHKPKKYRFEEFMAIIKFFILSPVEKKYIKKIEDELSEGDALDKKIKDLSGEIQKENEKKQNDFKSKASGKENPEKL